jgi:hypothetical protein
MPHKGTPIRYWQKQPVRSRQQGAENKVSVEDNLQVMPELKSGFLEVPWSG